MQSRKRIQNGYFCARHFICMGDGAAASAFVCSFLEYEKFLKMKVDRKTNVRISWKEKEKYTCVWRFVLTFMPVYIQTYVYIYLYVRIFVCVFDHNLAVHETTHIFLVWILNVKNTHSYVLKNESMIWTTPLYIILKCIFTNRFNSVLIGKMGNIWYHLVDINFLIL